MKLHRLAIMTGFMRSGMTLYDFFTEAVRSNVPGLPYVDAQDRIVGRISVRDVYKKIEVSDSVLRLADAMGDNTDRLDLTEMKVLEAMEMPIENFLLEDVPLVSPQSTVIKALALMEVHNTSYIFLVEDGRYSGVVTRMVITRRMLECVEEHKQGRTAHPDDC